MPYVSSNTLLLLAMGGKDPVTDSLHPYLSVYEVSIVCITLHPLLSRLVHLLLTWQGISISFRIAPHLENSHWVGKPVDRPSKSLILKEFVENKSM